MDPALSPLAVAGWDSDGPELSGATPRDTTRPAAWAAAASWGPAPLNPTGFPAPAGAVEAATCGTAVPSDATPRGSTLPAAWVAAVSWGPAPLNPTGFPAPAGAVEAATCGTVVADTPAGQEEQAVLTTVDEGGGAVRALAAAVRAASIPELLATFAIEGAADGGQVRTVVFASQTEQGTMTV